MIALKQIRIFVFQAIVTGNIYLCPLHEIPENNRLIYETSYDLKTVQAITFIKASQMKEQQQRIDLQEQIDLHQEKSKAIYSKIENCIDQMLVFYEQAAESMQDDDDFESVLLELNRQLIQLKPVKTVREYFMHYYHKLSNLIRTMRSNPYNPNLSTFKSSRKLSGQGSFNNRTDQLNQEKRFNSFLNSFISKPEEYEALDKIIIEHFLRQGELESAEVWGKMEEEVDPERVFRKSLDFRQAISRCQTEEAIAWCEQEQLFQKHQILLEYKLRKLHVSLLIEKQQYSEALAYLKLSMKKFHLECGAEISQLFTHILFRSPCHWQSEVQCINDQAFLKAVKERYSAFQFSQAKCEALGDQFVLEYLKQNGISRFDSLKVIYECSNKVMKQYLRLANVMWKDNVNKLGKLQKQEDIVLPFSVKLEKEYQYHSVFLCPVTKEVHSNFDSAMLLACGHVISKNAHVRIIQENRNKRKIKCPICQKEIKVDDCINASF